MKSVHLFSADAKGKIMEKQTVVQPSLATGEVRWPGSPGRGMGWRIFLPSPARPAPELRRLARDRGSESLRGSQKMHSHSLPSRQTPPRLLDANHFDVICSLLHRGPRRRFPPHPLSFLSTDPRFHSVF